MRISGGTVDNGGVKHDQDKVPLHLIPRSWFDGPGQVLAFGAKKYAPRNWERGMDWSRPYGALMRHMTAWWDGELSDPETGMSHLWHAACCLMFLIEYEQRRLGTDDRPHGPIHDAGPGAMKYLAEGAAYPPHPSVEVGWAEADGHRTVHPNLNPEGAE